MKNFTEWCESKGYTKDPIKGDEKLSKKEKLSGSVRDMRDDLSSDYKGHIKKNGTVAPFKVPPARGKAKQAAN